MDDFSKEIPESVNYPPPEGRGVLVRNMKQDLTYYRFKRFMLKKGVWERFVTNYKEDTQMGNSSIYSTIEEYIRDMIDEGFQENIILEAFDAHLTPEGFDFWWKINKELLEQFKRGTEEDIWA